MWMEAKSGGACQLEASVHMVVAANGEKLNITRQCTLQIAVGPLSKDHVVQVAKNLHQKCLLGADFFDASWLCVRSPTEYYVHRARACTFCAICMH